MGILQDIIDPKTSIIGGVFGVVEKMVDHWFPDPLKAAEAKLEVLKMQQAGDFKELDAQVSTMLGQLKVNEAEAASGSAFAAGWRPTVGYIGAASLAYQFVIYPIANYVIAVKFPEVTPPPVLDFGPLMTILMGMLGIGTLRTIEKIKGVAA